MVGQSICASHGGSAPQAIEAARRRLLDAIDPVSARLIETALSKEGSCPTCGRAADVRDDALRLRAQIALVDRVFASASEDARSVSTVEDAGADLLCSHMTLEELESVAAAFDNAHERISRGDAPLGAAGRPRRVITPPNRILAIRRVVVDTPVTTPIDNGSASGIPARLWQPPE